jgi:murein DD-endopeptidase MepM/ murein hydrolase activator NlpD
LHPWVENFLTGRITVVVVPRASENIRSYRIPVGLIYGALLLILVGTFVSGNAVLRAAELSRARGEVVRLSAENMKLAGRLGETESTLNDLSTQLAALNSFEEKIRLVADLEPTDDDVRRVGVGGPAIGSRVDLVEFRGETPEGLRSDKARTDAETLTRQTRLLRESFSEVLTTLTNRREELGRIPSILPVENAYVTGGYGYRSDPFTGRQAMHQGLDISARRGEPVVAAANGRVVSTGMSGDLGLVVEIDHGNGVLTRYGHTERIFVRKGQEVARGQVIAAVGSSGRSTNPHLHYEVRVNDRNVNPSRYILRTGT